MAAKIEIRSSWCQIDAMPQQADIIAGGLCVADPGALDVRKCITTPIVVQVYTTASQDSAWPNSDDFDAAAIPEARGGNKDAPPSLLGDEFWRVNDDA